jgi:hypothetical protein
MTISYLQLARNVQVGSAGKSRRNPHPHELGNGCWPSYRHRSQFRGMTHTSHTSHKSVGFWPMWSHVCWLRFWDGKEMTTNWLDLTCIEFFWRHPAIFLCSALISASIKTRSPCFPAARSACLQRRPFRHRPGLRLWEANGCWIPMCYI